MKICVINFSGNVGKTTVAANLLSPRIGGELYSVESLNQDASGDGVEVQRLRAQRYGELQMRLIASDSAVVDVGASNVELFLQQMEQHADSQADYDYFVVPTVKDRKQTTDTFSTIAALRRLGVEQGRIKVVFNKVGMKDVLAEEFEALFGFAAEGHISLNVQAALINNEVFELIKDYDMSLAEIIADPTDHREALRHETDVEARTLRTKRLIIKRLATSCAQNMDGVYAALFPK